EESAAGLDRSLDGGTGENAGFGVTAVQRADPDGDGEVEQFFALGQGKGFSSGLAEGECTGGDLGGRARLGLADGGGGAVDGEDEAPALQPVGDLARHGTGAAADFEDAHARFQGQRVDDLAKAGRKRRSHYSTGLRKFWLSQP